MVGSRAGERATPMEGLAGFASPTGTHGGSMQASHQLVQIRGRRRRKGEI